MIPFGVRTINIGRDPSKSEFYWGENSMHCMGRGVLGDKQERLIANVMYGRRSFFRDDRKDYLKGIT